MGVEPLSYRGLCKSPWELGRGGIWHVSQPWISQMLWCLNMFGDWTSFLSENCLLVKPAFLGSAIIFSPALKSLVMNDVHVLSCQVWRAHGLCSTSIEKCSSRANPSPADRCSKESEISGARKDEWNGDFRRKVCGVPWSRVRFGCFDDEPGGYRQSSSSPVLGSVDKEAAGRYWVFLLSPFNKVSDNHHRQYLGCVDVNLVNNAFDLSCGQANLEIFNWPFHVFTFFLALGWRWWL